ncbi:MAG: bacteriophage holin [Rhodospirillales bacterium]|nr:bacteriophage holin [Rhodospirillales bacterium]
MNDEHANEPAPVPAPAPAPPVTRLELGAISFGLALGLTAAILVFLLGISAAALGWGGLAAQVLSSIFIGFEPTFVGAIAGAVWAFAEGFIGGFLFAWFYNKIRARH